jgi:hypothetical protein
LLNGFSVIDHTLVNAPLQVKSFERLDLVSDGLGDLGPMAVFDTISTHGLSHSNELFEVRNFVLYLFSNLLEVGDTFSSEKSDGFTESSERIIDSFFKLLGVELFEVIMTP